MNDKNECNTCDYLKDRLNEYMTHSEKMYKIIDKNITQINKQKRFEKFLIFGLFLLSTILLFKIFF